MESSSMRKQGSSNLTPWDVVSVDEAARRLGVGQAKVYRLLQEGSLTGLKFKGQWRLAATEVVVERPALRLTYPISAYQLN